MEIADFGAIALMAAFAVCVYGTVVPHLGVRSNNWNLIRSAQNASILSFLLISIASAALLQALLISDFSLRYVWEHSSTDMPLLYKVSSFWGGLEGSLLFWVLVQSFFSMIVAFRYQYSNREIIPYVIATLNAILAFLLLLLIGWSNPLDLQGVIPLEGRGLNPLLQNPAMAIHPPSLYLGFIGFSVPFAFAMGGLILGKMDNEWVLTTRRWTLTAWYFLSAGLILGGQWAYEELGWGGFWAWDPVENAALMPWLTGTAFLHSVMIQEKRNMLKIWNVVLIILTFGLTIVGTFLTRSGIINSVHAFTQSEIGPAFLIFLAFILVIGFALLFKRIQMLESEHKIESVLCRENTFLAQNVLLVGIAFTVLLGTTFPLLAEAVRGTKLSIQAPFFNTIIAPMGYLLLLLMGVGTLIAWRKSSWEGLRRNFKNPLILATVGTVFLAWFLADRNLLWSVHTIFWLTIFVTSTIVLEIVKAVQAKSSQTKSNFIIGLFYVIARNPRRYGGLLIHFGVVLMFLGFAGTFFKVERNMTLEPGVPQQIGEYSLEFKQMEEYKVGNATHRASIVEVYDKEGDFLEVLKPAKSFYPTQPQPLTEVAIRRSFLEDLYLIFSSENGEEQGSITLRVFINPLVGWAWMALPVFTLGVGLSLSYRPKSLVAHERILRERYLAAQVLNS
ncbi:MAG: heme lyase CcmF/NrfE family subunit [SAR324 cluster bacterium]|jgi:cytochrome c-type biogenesis protein CcmF|nr:heme lyase CcmF/NrfE family subunit [SAR324 cluster bacterium]|tara:strand:- start:289 stop:2307 length:2019 start_codon:yes stop_codon:yes gene_type:complete